MPAPLTVIVPTLNAEQVLPNMLASLFEGVPDGLIAKVVFADGGSTDDTHAIAHGVGADVIDAPRGRGSQLRHAAQMATSEWYLFIHADTVLPPGWADTVRTHIEQDSRAGYGILRFDHPGVAARFVAGWANIRSRLFGLPYGDQTLLISATLYHQVGGYPNIPLMEDVAIARALGRRKRALPMVVTTGSDRYLAEGWVKRGWRNLGTLALYFMGRSPEQLVKRYQR